MKLDDLLKMKKEYQEKMKEVGEEALKDALKEFFDKHPAILAVRWAQYTPHFNDGEACVFGVREPQAQVEEDGDFLDSYDLKRAGKTAEAEAISDLEGTLSAAEDALEMAFGDHAQVVATREKVEVEEYDHD